MKQIRACFKKWIYKRLLIHRSRKWEEAGNTFQYCTSNVARNLPHNYIQRHSKFYFFFSKGEGETLQNGVVWQRSVLAKNNVLRPYAIHTDVDQHQQCIQTNFLQTIFLQTIFQQTTDYLPTGYLSTDYLSEDYLPTGYLPVDYLLTDYLPTGYLPTDYLPADCLPTDYLPTDYLHACYLPSDYLP